MSLNNIYLYQIFLKIRRKSNKGLLIFLLINQFLISGFCALLSNHWYIGILIGILLNLIVITLMISPFGEWSVRTSNGCGQIDHDSEDYKRFYRIFKEAHQMALEEDPHTPEQVDLFFRPDADINAFATGRHTICINLGTRVLDDATIYGIFAHELGHLAHFDTDDHILIYSSSVFIEGYLRLSLICMWFVTVISWIVALFTRDDDSLIVHLFISFAYFMTYRMYQLFSKVWSKVGRALTKKTCREEEYDADEFACLLGGGEALIRFFDNGRPPVKEAGLFALLAEDHPAEENRVARMREFLAAHEGELPVNPYEEEV